MSSVDKLQAQLQGLQHEVARSETRVRRLGLLALLLILLLVILLVSLHLYHVMQYATLSSVEATNARRIAGAADLQYVPESAGKVEFVREDADKVETLTDYATADKAKKSFTWSGASTNKYTLKVTYRQGFSLTTKDLSIADSGSRL